MRNFLLLLWATSLSQPGVCAAPQAVQPKQGGQPARAAAFDKEATLRLDPLRTLAAPTPLPESRYPGLIFSPDGSRLAVLWGGRDKEKGEAQVWEVETGKQLGRFPVKAGADLNDKAWAAFSPDGKLLALVGPREIDIRVVADGSRLLALPQASKEHHSLAFSPDGRLLAVGGDKDIAVWELSKKSVRRRLKGHEDGTTYLAFSPDGAALVSAGQMIIADAHVTIHTGDKLRLWDVAGGAEGKSPPGLEGQLWFAPTGHLLSAGQAQTSMRTPKGVTDTLSPCVSVVNPSLKHELFRWSDRGTCAVFSSDGRMVISASGKKVFFSEVATGQQLLAVPIPGLEKLCFQLASGGKLLATVRDDGAILLWDLSWRRLRPSEPGLTFSDADQERYWKELAGAAAPAHDLMWRLSQTPEPTVTFLAKRLQPVPARELPVARLIEDLDSPKFRVRDAAVRELTKASSVVEKPLRAALQAKGSLEMERRLEAILAERERRQPSGEELQQLRAIAVLEWSGAPQARQLLQSLAAGWPYAKQTQEAVAALARLGR